MANLENIERLQKKLQDLIRKSQKEHQVSIVVGFTQNYAVFVHENKEAHHNVGQSKFLEEPARALGKTLGSMTAQAVKSGATLEKALLLSGMRLQREAQQLTPVDTSALKASAFTAREEDLEGASAEAYANGESVRGKRLAQRAKAQARKAKSTGGKK